MMRRRRKRWGAWRRPSSVFHRCISVFLSLSFCCTSTPIAWAVPSETDTLRTWGTRNNSGDPDERIERELASLAGVSPGVTAPAGAAGTGGTESGKTFVASATIGRAISPAERLQLDQRAGTRVRWGFQEKRALAFGSDVAPLEQQTDVQTLREAGQEAYAFLLRAAEESQREVDDRTLDDWVKSRRVVLISAPDDPRPALHSEGDVHVIGLSGGHPWKGEGVLAGASHYFRLEDIQDAQPALGEEGALEFVAALLDHETRVSNEREYVKPSERDEVILNEGYARILAYREQRLKSQELRPVQEPRSTPGLQKLFGGSATKGSETTTQSSAARRRATLHAVTDLQQLLNRRLGLTDVIASVVNSFALSPGETARATAAPQDGATQVNVQVRAGASLPEAVLALLSSAVVMPPVFRDAVENIAGSLRLFSPLPTRESVKRELREFLAFQAPVADPKAVQVTIEGSVATVTVNRPLLLNALNDDVMVLLYRAMEALDANAVVKSIILTGSGRAFVAGADIQTLHKRRRQGERVSLMGQMVFRRIQQSKKFVIADVNGFALGGGDELALAAHYRVAGRNAVFGQPEILLGIIPGYAGTQRLARLLGSRAAALIVLSGAQISASRALTYGLVDVLADDPLATARDIAKAVTSARDPAAALAERTALRRGRIERLAKTPDGQRVADDPVVKRLITENETRGQGEAARRVVRAIDEGIALDAEAGDDLEATLFGEVMRTAEGEKGLSNFLERDPKKKEARPALALPALLPIAQREGIPETREAWIIRRDGPRGHPTEVIDGQQVLSRETLPMPDIADDEVLIEVYASPAEANAGRWLPEAKPVEIIRAHGNRFHIPGNNKVGVIVARGQLVPDLPHLQLGSLVVTHNASTADPYDRRMLRGDPDMPVVVTGYDEFRAHPAAPQRSGAYATFATAHFSEVMPKPGHLTFEQAAAYPLPDPTIWHNFRLTRLGEGDTLLLVGAAGSTGHRAIEIAKAIGVRRVIGLVSTKEKKAQIEALSDPSRGFQVIGILRTDYDFSKPWDVRRFVWRVRWLNRGRLADVALDFFGEGYPNAFLQAVKSGRPDREVRDVGRFTWYGAELNPMAKIQGVRGRATIDQMFHAIQRLRNLPQTGQVIDAAVSVLGDTEETRQGMEAARASLASDWAIQRVLTSGGDEQSLSVAQAAWLSKAKAGVVVRDTLEAATFLNMLPKEIPSGVVSIIVLNQVLDEFNKAQLAGNKPVVQLQDLFDTNEDNAARRALSVAVRKALGDAPDVIVERADPRALLRLPDGIGTLNMSYNGILRAGGQVVFLEDTHRQTFTLDMRGWVTQKDVLFPRKFMIGTHYASQTEAWLANEAVRNGTVSVEEPNILLPFERIAEGLERQGDGKVVFLHGIPSGLRTAEDVARARRQAAPRPGSASIARMAVFDPAGVDERPPVAKEFRTDSEVMRQERLDEAAAHRAMTGAGTPGAIAFIRDNAPQSPATSPSAGLQIIGDVLEHAGPWRVRGDPFRNVAVIGFDAHLSKDAFRKRYPSTTDDAVVESVRAPTKAEHGQLAVWTYDGAPPAKVLRIVEAELTEDAQGQLWRLIAAQVAPDRESVNRLIGLLDPPMEQRQFLEWFVEGSIPTEQELLRMVVGQQPAPLRLAAAIRRLAEVREPVVLRGLAATDFLRGRRGQDMSIGGNPVRIHDRHVEVAARGELNIEIKPGDVIHGIPTTTIAGGSEPAPASEVPQVRVPEVYNGASVDQVLKAFPTIFKAGEKGPIYINQGGIALPKKDHVPVILRADGSVEVFQGDAEDARGLHRWIAETRAQAGDTVRLVPRGSEQERQARAAMAKAGAKRTPEGPAAGTALQAGADAAAQPDVGPPAADLPSTAGVALAQALPLAKSLREVAGLINGVRTAAYLGRTQEPELGRLSEQLETAAGTLARQGASPAIANDVQGAVRQLDHLIGSATKGLRLDGTGLREQRGTGEGAAPSERMTRAIPPAQRSALIQAHGRLKAVVQAIEALASQPPAKPARRLFPGDPLDPTNPLSLAFAAQLKGIGSATGDVIVSNGDVYRLTGGRPGTKWLEDYRIFERRFLSPERPIESLAADAVIALVVNQLASRSSDRALALLQQAFPSADGALLDAAAREQGQARIEQVRKLFPDADDPDDQIARALGPILLKNVQSIIVSTSTLEEGLTPPAAIFADAVQPYGLPAGVPGISGNNVCAGCGYAIDEAVKALRSGENDVLVIVLDAYSKLLNLRKHDTSVFGDMATAMLIGSPDPQQAVDGYDVRFSPYVGRWTGAEINEFIRRPSHLGYPFFEMEPKTVDALSQKADGGDSPIVAMIKEVLARHGMTIKDVDIWVPHQPQGQMVDRLGRELEAGYVANTTPDGLVSLAPTGIASSSIAFYTGGQLANGAAAASSYTFNTALSAVEEAVRTRVIVPSKDRPVVVLLVGFGGGSNIYVSLAFVQVPGADWAPADARAKALAEAGEVVPVAKPDGQGIHVTAALVNAATAPRTSHGPVPDPILRSYRIEHLERNGEQWDEPTAQPYSFRKVAVVGFGGQGADKALDVAQMPENEAVFVFNISEEHYEEARASLERRYPEEKYDRFDRKKRRFSLDQLEQVLGDNPDIDVVLEVGPERKKAEILSRIWSVRREIGVVTNTSFRKPRDFTHEASALLAERLGLDPEAVFAEQMPRVIVQHDHASRRDRPRTNLLDNISDPRRRPVDARLYAWVKAYDDFLGKKVDFVDDAKPGYGGNRLAFGGLVREIFRLRQEGNPVEAIRSAARDPEPLTNSHYRVALPSLGFDPYRMALEVVAPHVTDDILDSYQEYYGKALGDRAPPTVNEVLAAPVLIDAAKMTAAQRFALRERLILAVLAEYFRLIDDQTLRHPRWADFELITGFGLSRRIGGLLQLADDLGLPELVARMDEVSQQPGLAHLAPTETVRRMAASGLTFERVYGWPDDVAAPGASGPRLTWTAEYKANAEAYRRLRRGLTRYWGQELYAPPTPPATDPGPAKSWSKQTDLPPLPVVRDWAVQTTTVNLSRMPAFRDLANEPAIESFTADRRGLAGALREVFLDLARRTRHDPAAQATLEQLLRRPENTGLQRRAFRQPIHKGLQVVIVRAGILGGNQMGRYYDKAQGMAVIAIDEQFFLSTIGRESDAPRHGRLRMFFERFLHELAHDNHIGTPAQELAEEARVVRATDWLLYEVLGGLQEDPDLEKFLSSLPPQVKAAVTGKGKYQYFKAVEQELQAIDPSQAGSSPDVSAREELLRRRLTEYAGIVVSGDLTPFAKAAGVPEGPPVGQPGPAASALERAVEAFPPAQGLGEFLRLGVMRPDLVGKSTPSGSPEVEEAKRIVRHFLLARASAPEVTYALAAIARNPFETVERASLARQVVHYVTGTGGVPSEAVQRLEAEVTETAKKAARDAAGGADVLTLETQLERAREVRARAEVEPVILEALNLLLSSNVEIRQVQPGVWYVSGEVAGGFVHVARIAREEAPPSDPFTEHLHAEVEAERPAPRAVAVQDAKGQWQRAFISLMPIVEKSTWTQAVERQVFVSQELVGEAVTVEYWMSEVFGEESEDDHAYHFDKEIAERLRFKERVAHGALTAKVLQAKFEHRMPRYAIDPRFDVKFIETVKLGQTIVPRFTIGEPDADGRAQVLMRAVSPDGRVHAELRTSISPREAQEPLRSSPEEAARIRQRAAGHKARILPVVDFRNPAVPRVQTVTKAVTQENADATVAMFDGISRDLLRQLLVIDAMAKTSFEVAPWHLLLGMRITEAGEPVELGDQLVMTATVPEPKDIKITTAGVPQPIITVEVRKATGALVVKGEVTKLLDDSEYVRADKSWQRWMATMKAAERGAAQTPDVEIVVKSFPDEPANVVVINYSAPKLGTEAPRATLTVEYHGPDISRDDFLKVALTLPDEARLAIAKKLAEGVTDFLPPTRVLINGSSGRIGTNVLRAQLQNPRRLRVVAENDPRFELKKHGLAGLENQVTLLKREFETASRSELRGAQIDSGQDSDGRYWISINGNRMLIFDTTQPEELPSAALKIDQVWEGSGQFTKRDAAERHLRAGAKRVIISAPATGAVTTVAPGINEEILDLTQDIFSCASCTTNAAAAPLKVLNDNYEILAMYVPTTHAVTQDTSMLAVLRPAAPWRGITQLDNFIVGTSGAGTDLAKLFPKLEGKIHALSIRGPVRDGSVIANVAVIRSDHEVTAKEINGRFAEYASGPLKRIMAYQDNGPIDAQSILGTDESSIVSGQFTRVWHLVDHMYMVAYVPWYDNEFGYSNRFADLANLIDELSIKELIAKLTPEGTPPPTPPTTPPTDLDRAAAAAMAGQSPNEPERSAKADETGGAASQPVPPDAASLTAELERLAKERADLERQLQENRTRQEERRQALMQDALGGLEADAEVVRFVEGTVNEELASLRAEAEEIERKLAANTAAQQALLSRIQPHDPGKTFVAATAVGREVTPEERKDIDERVRGPIGAAFAPGQENAIVFGAAAAPLDEQVKDPVKHYRAKEAKWFLDEALKGIDWDQWRKELGFVEFFTERRGAKHLRRLIDGEPMDSGQPIPTSPYMLWLSGLLSHTNWFESRRVVLLANDDNPALLGREELVRAGLSEDLHLIGSSGNYQWRGEIPFSGSHYLKLALIEKARRALGEEGAKKFLQAWIVHETLVLANGGYVANKGLDDILNDGFRQIAAYQYEQPTIQGLSLDETPKVLAFVREQAEFVDAGAIEVVDEADQARLDDEAIAAGLGFRGLDGNFYFFSHPDDTARSEERTMVLSRDPDDLGTFNNWHHTDEYEPRIDARLKDSYRRKKMYVVSYVAGPVNSPSRQLGVQVTDSLYVVVNQLRLYKIGQEALKAIGTGNDFERDIHATGDLDHIERDVPKGREGRDGRYFAAIKPDPQRVADGLEVWTAKSVGSAYGGNAILQKKFASLRMAMGKAQDDGNWLAEHMLIVGIQDLKTGKTTYVTGAFPSASGKTNLAMLQPPAALKDRYRVWLVSDDLAFLRIGSDNKLRAVNPEYGFFGVVPGTNQETNPSAMEAFGPNTGTIFTNVAVKLGVDAQGRTVVVDSWWEGKGPKPTDLEGWVDWKRKPLKDRTPKEADQPWAQANSRATSSIRNVSNWIGHAERLPEAERPTDWNHPEGVPISITLWGGRLDSREPLIRQLRDVASGVYDGVVMGAQTTAAQAGAVGVIRRDPAALRPFFLLPEVANAAHRRRIMERLGPNAPMFFHVNWFQKGADGKFIWPGFGENLRPLLWAIGRAKGDPAAAAIETPFGFVPTMEAIDRTGLEGRVSDEQMAQLLSMEDLVAWENELNGRGEFLAELRSTLAAKYLADFEELAAQHARDVRVFAQFIQARAQRVVERLFADLSGPQLGFGTDTLIDAAADPSWQPVSDDSRAFESIRDYRTVEALTAQFTAAGLRWDQSGHREAVAKAVEEERLLAQVRAIRARQPVRPWVAGNLKMYNVKPGPKTKAAVDEGRITPDEVGRLALREYLEALSRGFTGRDTVDVSLLVPYTLLERASEEVATLNLPAGFTLGAQSVSEVAGEGAFTSQISAKLAKEAGATVVVIGHSELRTIIDPADPKQQRRIRVPGKGLDHQTAVQQIKNARALGLTAILAIGETYDERQAGRTLEVIGEQIDQEYAPLTAQERAGVHLAYEPVWAIGTGAVATPQQAQEVHRFLHVREAQIAGVAQAAATRNLYGGSVKPDNFAGLLAQPDIDGGLVGGASLEADQFVALVQTPKTTIASIDVESFDATPKGEKTLRMRVWLADGTVSEWFGLPAGTSAGEEEAKIKGIDKVREHAQRIAQEILDKHLGDDLLRIHEEVIQPLNEVLAREASAAQGKTISPLRFGGIGGDTVLPFETALAYAIAESRGIEPTDLFAQLVPEAVGQGDNNLRGVVWSGGQHGAGKKFDDYGVLSMSTQEITIRTAGTKGAKSPWEAERMLQRIRARLAERLRELGIDPGESKEGGVAPRITETTPEENKKYVRSTREAITLVIQVAEELGYKVGADWQFHIDFAANSFFDITHGQYNFDGERVNWTGLLERYTALVEEIQGEHPDAFYAFEDPFAEFRTEHDGWREFATVLPQIKRVADDLTASQLDLAKEYAGLYDEMIVKPNQNGSLVGTLRLLALLKELSKAPILSHRSKEAGTTYDEADLLIARLAFLSGGDLKTMPVWTQDVRRAKVQELQRLKQRQALLSYVELLSEVVHIYAGAMQKWGVEALMRELASRRQVPREQLPFLDDDVASANELVNTLRLGLTEARSRLGGRESVAAQIRSALTAFASWGIVTTEEAMQRLMGSPGAPVISRAGVEALVREVASRRQVPPKRTPLNADQLTPVERLIQFLSPPAVQRVLREEADPAVAASRLAQEVGMSRESAEQLAGEVTALRRSLTEAVRFADFNARLQNGVPGVVTEIRDYFVSLALNDPKREELYRWLQHHESALSAKAIAAIGLNWPGVVGHLLDIVTGDVDGNPRAAARQLHELVTDGTYGGLPAPEPVISAARRLWEADPALAQLVPPLEPPPFPAVAPGATAGTLVLVRHGETSWSEAVLSKWAGWHDSKVTENGRREAVAAGSRVQLDELKFDAAYSSDLSRAVDTLDEVLKATGQTNVPRTQEKTLRERTYGDMIGWNRKDVERLFPKQYKQWRRGYAGNGVRPPGGENLADTQERALPFIVNRILADIAAGKTDAVSAHGNSLRATVVALREHTLGRKLTEEEILALEIPLSTPIIVTFDRDLHHRELWVHPWVTQEEIQRFLRGEIFGPSDDGGSTPPPAAPAGGLEDGSAPPDAAGDVGAAGRDAAMARALDTQVAGGALPPESPDDAVASAATAVAGNGRFD